MTATIEAPATRADAAAEAAEHLCVALETARAAIPDMHPHVLAHLREAITDLDEAIEAEQGDQEWVRANER
jgi:hypothetical protein